MEIPKLTYLHKLFEKHAVEIWSENAHVLLFLQPFFNYQCLYVCSGEILQLNLKAVISNQLSWNCAYTFSLDGNKLLAKWLHPKYYF